jgi:hypothetical protein
MFKDYYLKKLKKYKLLVLHTICKIFAYQYIDTSDSGTSPIPVPAPALPLYKCIFVKFRLIKMKYASGGNKIMRNFTKNLLSLYFRRNLRIYQRLKGQGHEIVTGLKWYGMMGLG